MLTNLFNKLPYVSFEADKGGAGGTGSGGGAAEDEKKLEKKSWETILEGLPEEVRKLYEEHTTGLKSALTSEREKSKGVSDKLKKLAELEAAEAKRAEKDLSEAQKASARLAEIERERDELAEKLATTRIRSAVEVQASALDFKNLKHAYLLADLSDVEIDEDGEVTGVEAALKALAKAEPYLLKAAGEKKGAPELDSGRKSTTVQPAEELKDKKRRSYGQL
jgi:hypothetical protein